jgi:hypothetical protein
MLAKYILAGLAAVFLIAATLRVAGDRGWSQPQARTWVLVGAVFGIVSAWLFYQGRGIEDLSVRRARQCNGSQGSRASPDS